MGTISAAGVLLTYPPAWRPAVGAADIPGLAIAHPVVVSPGGDAVAAGLVVGLLAGGEPTPLPRRFVARLRALPDPEVVGLPETQVYRYSRLSVPGFERTLTLYTIPNLEGSPTVVVCYASSASAASMRTCEQIVATLKLEGETRSYILTPDPEYAHQVSTLLGQVKAQRAALGREIHSLIARSAAQGGLARRLAAGLATAVASLSALQPPFVVSQAHIKLLESLAHARDAYTALAAAANAASPSRFLAARARVFRAEAGIGAALQSFVLLGYRQS